MISTVNDISSRLALDVQSVGQMRLQARNDPVAGARAAAQQFEALFLNMMLKSMREAIPQEGLFDDSNTQLYTSMLDSQLAQSLSKGKGIGLADMLVRQMQLQGAIPKEAQASAARAASGQVGRQILPVTVPVQTNPSPPVNVLLEDNAPATVPSGARVSGNFSGPAGFVSELWPHAADAAKQLGVPAHFLLGQAALESGWGKREIRDAQGNASHNLFGIKAGRNWQGATVESATTEYVNGTVQNKVELFRAYDSYADGFRDYVSLLRNNPRYAGLFERPLDAGAFANGLQQAGYATDPAYASKLLRVIGSETMSVALSS